MAHYNDYLLLFDGVFVCESDLIDIDVVLRLVTYNNRMQFGFVRPVLV